MSFETPKFKGSDFLKKKYSDLRKSEAVRLSHETSENKESNMIDTWLHSMEAFHERQRNNPESMELIRKAFHDEYVIKPENVGETYFQNQERLMRELGHGNVEIGEQTRQEGINIIIKDQEASLDNWVNYIFSKDADVYPMWAKYFVIRSMVKLSSYDKEKKAFGNRRKDTVSPFPDLNREALAYVIDILHKKAKQESIELDENNPELQKLIESENFGKLYAYAIEQVTPTEVNELMLTEGEWRKYPQGSDHLPLVESIQGHGTGWCTAGESTAKTQLQGGDFHVYYSIDKQGNYTIPRTAIRMQGSQIGEVRGIAPDQNLDPYMGKIVDEKLSEFPDKEKYKKKTADMNTLTLIERKQSKGEELTKEDLRFLYELDSRIEGFGYRRDPRIEELREARNIKEDLVSITGFKAWEISTTEEEALSGGIKFHYGNLCLGDIESNAGLKLPESINGNLDLYNLKSAEDLKLPKTINGTLNLSGLQSAEDLKLPETINGSLNLYSLESAEGLKLPETLNGDLYFRSLQSAEGLKLPETINGYLSLSSLKSAEGLILPETLNGDLRLGGLQSAEGLKLPETLNGGLNLYNLKSAEGLILPETLNGFLNLSSLKSAEGLILPETLNGDLRLGGLKSAEGLELPETLNGEVYLQTLKDKEKERLRRKYPDIRIV
ncbi:MAG: hypothetical protein ACOXZP_00540 [Minisyncoccales bacterium]|jgi:hypothetical protein